MQERDPHINKLLRLSKKGDRNAQFELYKRYYKAMFNTAFRILDDRFEAEDVMQEAFLSAFDNLDGFRGEVSFGSWLKRIVINRSLTQLKRMKKTTFVSMDKVEDYLEADDAVNEETGFSSEELSNTLLAEQIQNLKKNYRIALSLRFIEGYDNEEIAQIMGISHENTRTLISRAKQKLKNQLLKQNLV